MAQIQCCHGCGVGLSCSSDSTPSLGTSICCRCSKRERETENLSLESHRGVGEGWGGKGRPNPSPPLQDLNILPSWPLASWLPAVGPSLVAGWPRTSLGKPNRSLFSSVWRPPIPWPVLADAPARTPAPSPQHPLLSKSSPKHCWSFPSTPNVSQADPKLWPPSFSPPRLLKDPTGSPISAT